MTESNTQFSKLESTILKSKGLNDEQLSCLHQCGITSKADFITVGDATTLAEITGLSLDVAEKVMAWATDLGPNTNVTSSESPESKAQPTIIVDSPDVICCTHCSTKQPPDYKSGDLCFNCGKQAQPVKVCFWCSSSGPGTFCRQCGSEFVPVGELELAYLLKHQGVSKDDIAPKLKAMDEGKKESLWELARKR